MVKYTGVPAAVATWILGHRRIGFSPTPKRLGRAKEVFASLHFGRMPISLVAVLNKDVGKSRSKWMKAGSGWEAGSGRRQEVDGAHHGAMRLVMTDHQSRC